MMVFINRRKYRGYSQLIGDPVAESPPKQKAVQSKVDRVPLVMTREVYEAWKAWRIAEGRGEHLTRETG